MFNNGTRVRAIQNQERKKWRPVSELKPGDDIFTKVSYIDVAIGDTGTVVQVENVMGETHVAIDWDNGSKCAYEIGHLSELAEEIL